MSSTAESGKDVPELLTVSEIEGKGRALVANQPLKAGQIILKDSPLLVYSAFPLTDEHQQNHSYCSNCFRILKSTPIFSCPRCASATKFCNPNCLSIALSSSHTPYICKALCDLRVCPSPLFKDYLDRQIQARFLLAAYNLASISPSNFQTLMSLQGDADPIVDDTSLFLHTLVSSLSLFPSLIPRLNFTPALTAALLAKDKLNAFGLMEPFEEDKERSVRAYGIYPRASFFNHDCLPNACRFDYLDSADPPADVEHNTDIIVRMIHDVPEGREICLSYFPVNFKYSDRQQRLRDDYGFSCECDRCKVEANWSDEESMDDDDDNDDDEEMEEMEKESDEVIEEEKDFPHAYFFMRYMCNRNNCWGTLAPVPSTDRARILSSSSSSSAAAAVVLECNVCGNYEELDEPEG